jgi:ubiquinone/menaquinone biosynthesis C-methylase UbiE
VPEPRNQCAGPFGAAYDFYIEREWLMRAIGRAVWGIDLAVLYASFEPVACAGNGATIIDVPCGGGVAFRALRPDQEVRYMAADLSEKMLARARRRAEERSLKQIDFCVADMCKLPFEDDAADLFLSYSGLHMIAEPEAAIREIARCLKPGGELIGTTFLLEGSRRQRTIFEIGRRRGHALPLSRHRLHEWFADAGIVDLLIEPQKGFVVFRGRKRAVA